MSVESLEDRYLLSASITEFPIPTADTGPAGITAGPDGNLWFTEVNGFRGNRVGRITPAGIVTEFAAGITPGSQPLRITAGPDGNLWFTEVDAIGRITPAGTVTEFRAGITGSQPAGITAGPDGNLWFTEFGAIGRITPAGVVTEFRAGLTPNSVPFDITAGPDGSLWFTELLGGIGRITTAGTITEFRAGITDGLQPAGITAGPDGNLWFTEFGGRIGRITTDGQVTEFATGITPGSGPNGITAGPDDSLWFTERNGNRIARITTAGVVTEFAMGITPGSLPEQITTGPDGNLWFTELEGNRIGRLVPPQLAATATALSADVNTVVVGQTVHLMAMVTGAAGIPTGTVTFLDGANALGTAALDGTGTATLAVAFPTAGAHALTAVYSGDGSFATSTSDVLTEKVRKRRAISVLSGPAAVPVRVGLMDVTAVTSLPLTLSSPSAIPPAPAGTAPTTPLGQPVARPLEVASVDRLFASDQTDHASLALLRVQHATPAPADPGLVDVFHADSSSI